jgi:lysozyme
MSRLLVTAATILAVAPAAQAYVRGIDQAYVRGIDVSHFNGSIDWPRVAGAGYRFVYAKATEGNTLNDAPYATNRAGAGASQLKFGAYHFARPGGATRRAVEADAVAEADHFLRVAQPHPGDLLPVLDLEVTGGLTPPLLVHWTWSWLREVEAQLRVKAIIYTSPHFWETPSSGSRTTRKRRRRPSPPRTGPGTGGRSGSGRTARASRGSPAASTVTATRPAASRP